MANLFTNSVDINNHETTDPSEISLIGQFKTIRTFKICTLTGADVDFAHDNDLPFLDYLEPFFREIIAKTFIVLATQCDLYVLNMSRFSSYSFKKLVGLPDPLTKSSAHNTRKKNYLFFFIGQHILFLYIVTLFLGLSSHLK